MMNEKTQKGQEQQQFLIMPFVRGIVDFANNVERWSRKHVVKREGAKGVELAANRKTLT